MQGSRVQREVLTFDAKEIALLQTLGSMVEWGAMKLTAEKREILGKKVESLRRQGLLPAVVFGKETGSIPITLNQKEFLKVYEEAGESALIDIVLEDQKPIKVLVTETDIHPVSDEILHVNLHAVSLTKKATATIPIELVGESSIVKSGEGMLLTLLDAVEVEALPQDLPPEIKLDISGLTEIAQSLAVKDLPVDRAKVEIKQDAEELVVKIEHAEMAEEEVEEEEATVEGVEVTTEKKGEEEGEESKPEEAEAKEQS